MWINFECLDANLGDSSYQFEDSSYVSDEHAVIQQNVSSLEKELLELKSKALADSETIQELSRKLREQEEQEKTLQVLQDIVTEQEDREIEHQNQLNALQEEVWLV